MAFVDDATRERSGWCPEAFARVTQAAPWERKLCRNSSHAQLQSWKSCEQELFAMKKIMTEADGMSDI